MNTAEKHHKDGVIHIPAMFGDDFAYKQAGETFRYIDELNKLIMKHSKERYG